MRQLREIAVTKRTGCLIPEIFCWVLDPIYFVLILSIYALDFCKLLTSCYVAGLRSGKLLN